MLNQMTLPWNANVVGQTGTPRFQGTPSHVDAANAPYHEDACSLWQIACDSVFANTSITNAYSSRRNASKH